VPRSIILEAFALEGATDADALVVGDDTLAPAVSRAVLTASILCAAAVPEPPPPPPPPPPLIPPPPIFPAGGTGELSALVALSALSFSRSRSSSARVVVSARVAVSEPPAVTGARDDVDASDEVAPSAPRFSDVREVRRGSSPDLVEGRDVVDAAAPAAVDVVAVVTAAVAGLASPADGAAVGFEAASGGLFSLPGTLVFADGALPADLDVCLNWTERTGEEDEAVIVCLGSPPLLRVRRS
jgi:hypothetical protein